MENGRIKTITSADFGLGTITPDNGPGVVSFSIATAQGPWSQYVFQMPVRFTRSANDPTIATSVAPA